MNSRSRQCTQGEAYEQQIEKQRRHDEEREQPVEGDGECHRREGEQEQHGRQCPLVQLLRMSML
jgi:hypothetical protein